jgi:5-formyltetrahydrofolate cyclo-ligase
VRVGYPRVAGARALALHLAAPDALRPGHFGIAEPPADAKTIAPEELDWIVLPGLAFDRAGGRVGFGKGYYDALCALAPRALRIGVAYPWQVVPEVPAAPHDQRLDLIIADRAHATCARPIPPSERSAR